MQTRQRNTKRSPTCLLVASSGGHLHQLWELRDGWPREARTWVTFDTPDVPEVLAGERVVYARHPTNRNIPNLRGTRCSRSM